jgi:hypothetical protein
MKSRVWSLIVADSHFHNEMPDLSEYDQVVDADLWPHFVRAQDPELLQCTIDVVEEETAVGALHRPWSQQGSYAVVYRFCSPQVPAAGAYTSAGLRAVRLFRSPVPGDQAERYRRIGEFFSAKLPDCTARFAYYDPGVEVPRDAKSTLLVPLIDMEWVAGESLHSWVDARCELSDRSAIEQLMWQWADLMRRFQSLEVAHGDLSGTNVMVTPQDRLVVIDYDGVYVPTLAEMPMDGVGGIPDYQSPDRVARRYGARMDDFSALVIFTTLAALRLDPTLRERYGATDASTGGLLFRHEDFVTPERSALFGELEVVARLHADELLEAAVTALRTACDPGSTVLPYAFPMDNPVRRELEALLDVAERAAVEDAASSEAADAAVDEWTRLHVAELVGAEGLTPKHRGQIGAVRRRHRARLAMKDAWHVVETADRSGDHVAAERALYNSLPAWLSGAVADLSSVPGVPPQYDPFCLGARIARCRSAIGADDDAGIINALNADEGRPPIAPWLQNQERARAELARERQGDVVAGLRMTGG